MNVTTMIAPEAAPSDSLMGDIFRRQQQTALRLRSSTAADRIATLKKLEAAVLANQDALHRALLADLHKSPTEADLSEIMPVIGEIHHTIKHLKSWMRTKRAAPTMVMLGTKARIRYEPKGVSLLISPWNYPVMLTLAPLACAIGAGNAVIIKPSEMTPATSAVLARMIAATFDPSEIALFEGDSAVATGLLALPFDHIFFTGSPVVGKIVMAAAARHLASVTLELGGKSPVIVDDSADLGKTIKSLLWGKFINNGQTCIAPDYLYVHEKILPEFLDRAKTALAGLYGANTKTNPDYGRIVNERHFTRVKRLLDDATAQGATVVTGGAVDAADKFIAPTLLLNVNPDSLVMQEEIFGPILPIIPYTDLAGPIAHINANPKPLALYVYARDEANITRIIEQTSSGGVCINTSVLHVLHNNLPFGGVNNSGIGSSNGVFGFRAFSHERAILREQFSSTPMLYPPYTRRVQWMLKMIMRFFA
jgi:aldehyde dehydrogenase (NAD+)